MIRKVVKSLGEHAARFNRLASKETYYNIGDHLSNLKTNGFVVLDHLVDTKELDELKRNLDKKVEVELDLKFPCLAQSKIDIKKDYDLITTNFLTSKENLTERDLTFSRNDIQSYEQMMTTFQPSTLTVPMPSEIGFYDFWLDPVVLAIVSQYMGFYPHLSEAYIRRNFPCTYPVMNHNWHRDTNHDKHLLKAFVFFTDCNINTGAHHYIAGSIHDQRFREKIYYTDDEINTVWPISSKDHMISTVKAGTIIIEDTRGLHKAGIPKKDFRDLGYAVFIPPNLFRRQKPTYHIKKSVFDGLTHQQKLFIPTQNIVNG